MRAMGDTQWENCGAETLLEEFFAQDDLRQLSESAGKILDCPLLVLDDTFHVAAYRLPQGFSDELFQNVVSCGEITYEAGVLISRSPALSEGRADFLQLPGSPGGYLSGPIIPCRGALCNGAAKRGRYKKSLP